MVQVINQICQLRLVVVSCFNPFEQAIVRLSVYLRRGSGHQGKAFLMLFCSHKVQIPHLFIMEVLEDEGSKGGYKEGFRIVVIANVQL